jgi:hypothetical protein
MVRYYMDVLVQATVIIENRHVMSCFLGNMTKERQVACRTRTYLLKILVATCVSTQKCSVFELPLASWTQLMNLIALLPAGVMESTFLTRDVDGQPKFTSCKCALCHKKFTIRGKIRRRATKCKGHVAAHDANAAMKCLALVCRYDNECEAAGEPCPHCHACKPCEILSGSPLAIHETLDGPVPKWMIPFRATRYLHNGRQAARWTEEV